ncbi:MAG: 1-acyl-sn-glycerol-3-phosphate acyltransferase [Mogibacterium sp.]|nr:1-acyl-sn-glycerol-3-phosphate acyltransferase [Mogibacterium sp.]
MADTNQADQRLWLRHRRIWSVLVVLLRGWIRRKFNFTYEPLNVEGPVILIPNHSCAWDPLLVGVAMGRRRQIYFVASEHILRWRFAGPILRALVDPIPRKKAVIGAAAAKTCLRHLKAGHSVCLFAEGEQTWDGLTQPVFPSTGKLVRQSGATLVTYRLEGAYLSLPRWAKGVRRGKVYGHPVNIYPPEVLRTMKPEEITAAIDRDLQFDVWKWQEAQPEGPASYQGKDVAPAGHLERALFACPSCRSIGTLKAAGDELHCTNCGFQVRYLPTGFLDPPEPFRTIADWDAWERVELTNRLADAISGGEPLAFNDGTAELSRVDEDHTDVLLTTGDLAFRADGQAITFSVGEEQFDLNDVTLMAPVLTSLLLFSIHGVYYQIHPEDANVRKYVLAWQYLHKQ